MVSMVSIYIEVKLAFFHLLVIPGVSIKGTAEWGCLDMD